MKIIHNVHQSLVGSQFAFLSYPYKLPTPVFCNPWFSSQSLNKTTLLFGAFAHLLLFLFSWLQAWKLWFRSHIKIVTGLLWLLLSMCSLCFQFNYSRTVGKIPRSLLIWHSLIVNMNLFLQDCDDILMIEFLMHWWFDFYVLSSISFTHWFHENTLTIVVIPLGWSFHTTHISYDQTLGVDFKLLLWF